MPTTFVKGDLFEDTQGPDLHALAFAAECSGSMEQGVASAFAKRWPEMAEAFRVHAGEKGIQPGHLFAWRKDTLVVYALGILRGEEKPKLAAFTHAVETMIARATEDGVPRIGLARVGGLDPARVKRVLTDAGAATAIDLVVFEQFVRARPPPA